MATALRFVRLDGSSLWSDEGNSWAMLRRGFGAIAGAAAQDIHPPGYYWLLKAWCLVAGGDAWGMRSLSALCGVVLVGVVYRIGLLLEADSTPASYWVARPHPPAPSPNTAGRGGARAWWMPGIALAAALLAAVNPFLIHYSQEARMYSLLALESGLLFWGALLLARGGSDSPATDPMPGPDSMPIPDPIPGPDSTSPRSSRFPFLLFALSAAAGLWTHYSFPIVLAAADLFLLVVLWRRSSPAGGWSAVIGPLLFVNLPAVLLFSPWLPTAWRAVTQWPTQGRSLPLIEALPLLGRSFAFGPLGPEPMALLETNLGLTGAPAIWALRVMLLLALVLPLLGLWSLRRRAGGAALLLWLGAPVGLMFGLGLFGDAFQKFLLVAVPGWCLAVAAAVVAVAGGGFGGTGMAAVGTRRSEGLSDKEGRTGGAGQGAPAQAPWYALWGAGRAWSVVGGIGLLTLGGLLPAVAALGSVYRAPGLRDDYAGVARALAASGDAVRDLVLLCAPGQAEVWDYYDPGLPVLALPAERPPDAAGTVAALEAATRGRRQITALWWAAADADPQGIIAGWLAAHAFLGPTRWAGNVQVAEYGLAQEGEPLDCAAPPNGADFSDGIRLEAVCGPRDDGPAPGRLLLAALRWRATVRPSTAYVVSVQLLRTLVDPGAPGGSVGGAAGSITGGSASESVTEPAVTLIAQQDGQPVGGTRPTDGWSAGEGVEDRHAVAIPMDAVAGDYLLRVALYRPADGMRLMAGDRDHVDLPVTVVKGALPKAGTPAP